MPWLTSPPPTSALLGPLFLNAALLSPAALPGRRVSRKREWAGAARKGKSIRGKRGGDWLLRRINVLPFWRNPSYTPPMKNSLQGWSRSWRSGIWGSHSFEKLGTSEITGCHLGTLVSLMDHCDFILCLQGRHKEPSNHWDPVGPYHLPPALAPPSSKAGRPAVTWYFAAGLPQLEWDSPRGGICLCRRPDVSAAWRHCGLGRGGEVLRWLYWVKNQWKNEGVRVWGPLCTWAVRSWCPGGTEGWGERGVGTRKAGSSLGWSAASREAG